jgi:uracil-DNA glycosylase
MEKPPRNTYILFIFSIPSEKDTFMPEIGYLSFDPEVDMNRSLFFDLVLDELGWEIDDLFVANAVLCLPRLQIDRRPLSMMQQQHCARNLKYLIDLFKPMIICPLGSRPLESLAFIQPHGRNRLRETVAIPVDWYNRVLFPLYDTTLDTLHSTRGRTKEKQRRDWQKLRNLYNVLRTPL